MVSEGPRPARAVRLAAVGALCLALLAGCAADGEPADDDKPDSIASRLEATETTGVVYGIVVDAAIRPVQDAQVTIRSEPPQEALTNTDGEFGFDGLRPATYSLEVVKAGFDPVIVTVRVQAGIDDPERMVVNLAVNPENRPFVQASFFRGFIECGFANGANGWFAACAAGPIANNLLCGNYDVCLGNITNERSFTFIPVDAVPDWVQQEMAWRSTQALGDDLRLMMHYGTLEEYYNGGFSGTVNRTLGTSPIYVTMNRTVAEEVELGTENSLTPQALSAARPETIECVDYVVGRYCSGAGAALQQDFELFTHVFFRYTPPEGWRFTDTGEVPPP